MRGRPLILSIFPGIDLLGRAFEEEWPECCIVRGPDPLWGGDIRTFHPPAGVFDGVIGGPPCQMWARTRNFKTGIRVNLIPEFERVVHEAGPTWFLMENVLEAPVPAVGLYPTRTELVRDVWVGGVTNRLRRFSYGGPGYFAVDQLAIHDPEPAPTVVAGGSTRRRDGSRYRDGRNYGAKTQWAFEQGRRLQGLPDDFELPPFTVQAKVAAIGNGVPLPMGRAIARAVKRALSRV